MAADVNSDIKNWSTTESSNSPSGSTSISTNLDDNLRMVQKVVRDAFEAAPWFNYGHTYTYASATQFTIGTPSTDQTSVYEKGRTLKASVTAGTIYGRVTSSSFAASTTTVNCEWDNSGALDAGLSAVWVGPPRTGNPLGILGSPRVHGFYAINNSSTPATKIDLVAQAVTLRNPTNGETITRWNTGTITNDFTQASAANGRDSGGTPADLWVHLYYIWNGTTLATVASATAPPTGPTLPSGYTHWSYALSVYFSGTVGAGGAYHTFVCRGNRFYYGFTDGGTARALAAGQQTSMTSVSCSTLVPPATISGVIFLHGTMLVTHTSAAQFAGYVRPDGASYETNGRRIAGCYVGAANQTAVGDGYIELPNLAQTFAYRINTVPATSGGLYVEIDGYTVPNGG